ncbi:putative quinol monooxygenase [Parablastomonas sp. CN1-191]|uniref:putative quinol monooxygenase n=1 Tax=Parablastomonas sp. CN1-191 TaxID=3400908 RepID=UPI003BF8D7C1
MLMVEGWLMFAPDDVDAMLPHIAVFTAATRAEAGCLHHAVGRDIADPAVFRVTERWQDDRALTAHAGGAVLAAFEAALDAHPPVLSDVRLYTVGEVRRVM